MGEGGARRSTIDVPSTVAQSVPPTGRAVGVGAVSSTVMTRSVVLPGLPEMCSACVTRTSSAESLPDSRSPGGRTPAACPRSHPARYPGTLGKVPAAETGVVLRERVVVMVPMSVASSPDRPYFSGTAVRAARRQSVRELATTSMQGLPARKSLRHYAVVAAGIGYSRAGRGDSRRIRSRCRRFGSARFTRSTSRCSDGAGQVSASAASQGGMQFRGEFVVALPVRAGGGEDHALDAGRGVGGEVVGGCREVGGQIRGDDSHFRC